MLWKDPIMMGDYIIMDNDKLVGNNCITFIYNTEKGRVKYKFYNKCQRQDWIFNNILVIQLNEQLKNSINESLDISLLQLEIIFYINSNIVSEEYIHNNLSYL